MRTRILAAWNEGLRAGRSAWERAVWVTAWRSRDWFSLRSAFAASSATVSGTVTYEKKLYNSAGFTGATQFEPVQFVVVEVVDAASNGTTVIGTAATNANGNYTATVNFTTTSSAYVRVLSELDVTASGGIRAQVLNVSAAMYAVTTSASPFSITNGGTYAGKNLSVTVSSGASGAFNILDDFVTGGQQLLALGVPASIPMITAYWQVGGTEGTYYDPNVDSIYLCGGGGSPCISGDTDEFDDAVILHEYGHFVANHYSRDDSPGGDHSIVEHTQDIRLSWSEGWASFWSAAVRNDPVLVDTVGTGAFTYDISGGACPSGGGPPEIIGSSVDCTSGDFVMTTNETSVSNVLWNIFDPSSSGVTFANDSGLGAIWDVFENYIPNVAPQRANFEAFWDGWFFRSHGSPAALEAITNQFRGMAFCADSSEPNDTSGAPVTIASVPSTLAEQTLYTASGMDNDYFSVSLSKGVAYTIKTANLNNGADTFLTVLTGGATLKTNDNSNKKSYASCDSTSSCPPNDASTLASSVALTPASTDTYTILVQHSSSAPPSAARYGGYDLSITSP